jgi:hypothetical protein
LSPIRVAGVQVTSRIRQLSGEFVREHQRAAGKRTLADVFGLDDLEIANREKDEEEAQIKRAADYPYTMAFQGRRLQQILVADDIGKPSYKCPRTNHIDSTCSYGMSND